MTAIRVTRFKKPSWTPQDGDDSNIVTEAQRITMIRKLRTLKEGTSEYGELESAIQALVPVLPNELVAPPEAITEQAKLGPYAKSVFFKDETENNPYDCTYWVPVRVYPDPYEPEIKVKTTTETSM